jgi:hypothetical protein
MKLKQLLIWNAVISLIYGIGLMLVPAFMTSTYGVTQGPGQWQMAQYYGVALTGVGVLSWFARNVTDSKAQRGNILGFLIYHICGLIVSLSGTLRGVMSWVGWSGVAIYLFLGLGFAYFQFFKLDEV